MRWLQVFCKLESGGIPDSDETQGVSQGMHQAIPRQVIGTVKLNYGGRQQKYSGIYCLLIHFQRKSLKTMELTDRGAETIVKDLQDSECAESALAPKMS